MAMPMPDDVIDKVYRKAQQQKNIPSLVFADRNLNPDEYDDDHDYETYHDVDNDEEEDEEVLSYNKEEGNDDDDEEIIVDGLPVADDDEEDNEDDSDEMGGQAVEPVDLGQPPDCCRIHTRPCRRSNNLLV